MHAEQQPLLSTAAHQSHTLPHQWITHTPYAPPSHTIATHTSTHTQTQQQQQVQEQEQEQEQEEKDEQQWFTELAHRPWRSRPSSLWIFPWSVLIGINTGLVLNIQERLRMEVICRDLLPKLGGDLLVTANSTTTTTMVLKQGLLLAPIDECKTATMLQIVRQIDGRIGTIAGICILLTLAKWCSTSDLYGRKFLMHIGLIGIALSTVLNWFAASSYNFLGYYVYYLEAVCLCLFPGGPAINPASFAYLTDCTQKDRRGMVFGYLIISQAVGTILGTTLSTVIVTAKGDETVILRISLVLTGLIAVYLSFMPESLRKKKQAVSPSSSAIIAAFTNNNNNDVHRFGASNGSSTTSGEQGHTEQQVWTVRRIGEWFKEATSMMFDPIFMFLPGRIPKTANMPTSATPILVLSAYFLECIGVGTAVVFITMVNLLFHWTVAQDGQYETFISFSKFIVFLGIVPLANFLYRSYFLLHYPTIFGSSTTTMESTLNCDSSRSKDLVGADAIAMDLFFSICGLSVSILAHILVPTFPSASMLYFAGALTTIGMVSRVSVLSVLTSVIPNHRVGAALGAHSICQILAIIVSDLIYGPLFVYGMKNSTTATNPLFYYYVSAGFFALALLVHSVNWLLYYHHRRK
ncbi:MAG: major facilitator superfamily domain-containing protein [Linnemannia gamsii]|nr:MAG: major facilitator superfamily domain-containing protein [Linnemannia gamsii]